MWIKTENNDFQIQQTRILFTMEHGKDQVFKLRKFTVLTKNVCLFWICSYTSQITLGREQLKTGKVGCPTKKRHKEHFATDFGNLQYLSNMTE